MSRDKLPVESNVGRFQTPVLFYVSPEMKQAIRDAAGARNVSMSQWIRDAIVRKLKGNQNEYPFDAR